jgi:hypothetical protein
MEWEYNLEDIVLGKPVSEIEEELNDAGSGGWEAVTVFPSSITPGHFFVLFKRPKR